jgi:outer membrane protein OmpA-like peptidoglycan-associated protein
MFNTLHMRRSQKAQLASLVGVYSFYPEELWTPYIQAGVGIGAGIRGSSGFKKMATTVGLGTEYFLGPRFSLRGGVDYHSLAKAVDSRKPIEVLVPHLGFVFHMGPKRHSKPLESVVESTTSIVETLPTSTPITVVEIPSVPVKQSEPSLSLVEDIQFQTEKWLIPSSSRRMLKSVAGQLRDHPQARLELEGHADSRGLAVYNRSLSKRRWMAVRDYLVKNEKIQRDRIRGKAYGEHRPVATNKTKAGRVLVKIAKNKPYLFAHWKRGMIGAFA